MKKLFVYIAIFLLLILAKVSGLILWDWQTIVIIILAFIIIAAGLVIYGFVSAGIQHSKTRRFWEMYRRDHEDLNQDIEED